MSRTFPRALRRGKIPVVMRLSAAVLLALAAPACARDSSGTPSRGVDLLRLIDPEKDAVAGKWTREGGVLATPQLQFGRLLVPYLPPSEYDLRAVVERRAGDNSLTLGLVAGGKQFVVILDAAVNGVATSGLDLVDSKSFYDNETTARGALFENGRKSAVHCSVRAGSVAVAVDGKRVIAWKGDPARLSLWSGWTVKNRKALFIGAWTSPIHIHKLELLPVTGKGEALR